MMEKRKYSSFTFVVTCTISKLTSKDGLIALESFLTISMLGNKCGEWIGRKAIHSLHLATISPTLGFPYRVVPRTSDSVSSRLRSLVHLLRCTPLVRVVSVGRVLGNTCTAFKRLVFAHHHGSEKSRLPKQSGTFSVPLRPPSGTPNPTQTTVSVVDSWCTRSSQLRS